MRRSVHATALLAIAALVVINVNVVTPSSSYFEEDSLLVGPYIDEVIYKVIANPDQRVLALQAGEIDMDNSFFDPVHVLTLSADPDISIHEAVRNGYGHITINCAKYPLNISGFRRAFAFAFDKTRVTHESQDGLSLEHDSLVPHPNGWCAEDQFDWHYYTGEPEIGNQILDDLGFEIDGGSGFRLAPDGTPFEVAIEYMPTCGTNNSASIAVDALHSLHVDAHKEPADFIEYISRLDSHGDYDMVVYALNFFDDSIEWLAYEYWSEYADVQYENPTNFRNATYDAWRDQLLYGSTYEEVYEAAAEMQKILHYNVPRLVTYENIYLQGYRNDQFTGHVEDTSSHISGQWTTRNIRYLDGSLGGSVSIALAQGPDSFNIYCTNSVYAKTILQNLWPSLYKYGPDLTPWPDLAKSMVTETHSDNSAVPEGHTRFTIDIIQNATWSDGTPITGRDIAFSFTYVYESGAYENPAAVDLGDLFAAYSPTPYRTVIEFCTESYWHFNTLAYDYIIPYHIFNNKGGIGIVGWASWNPVFDPAEPNVNCGPFIFSDYKDGEYYTIERNPLFHYAAIPYEPITEPTSTTTTTTTSTSTPTTTSITTTSGQTGTLVEQQFNFPLAISSAIAGFSIIVALYMLVLIIQKRRNLNI